MRICHQIISVNRKEGKQNQGKRWWEGNCNLVLTRVGRTSLTGTSLSLLPKPPSTTCHMSAWWVPHGYVGATWVCGCHMGVWWVPHGCGWGICLPPATRQMSCFLRSIRSAFYNCTAVESDSMHHNILPLKCLQYSAVSILWSNIYPIHFHTSAIWYKSNRYNTYNSKASGWVQLERISGNQQHRFSN